eukprot:TRINITY_DN1948_c0_g1_i10.p2 TRINITY_DN1948_c0_g1~~TRINITY_DN1948_c0_g1_i10.p2  ORF type:complete len:206 (+),score=-16.16 TRINITY_DN1948_c0_g1_i10:65-682(+)
MQKLIYSKLNLNVGFLLLLIPRFVDGTFTNQSQSQLKVFFQDQLIQKIYNQISIIVLCLYIIINKAIFIYFTRHIQSFLQVLQVNIRALYTQVQVYMQKIHVKKTQLILYTYRFYLIAQFYLKYKVQYYCQRVKQSQIQRTKKSDYFSQRIVLSKNRDTRNLIQIPQSILFIMVIFLYKVYKKHISNQQKHVNHSVCSMMSEQIL